MIFEVVMRSFPVLCFQAISSLVVLKRKPRGLLFADEDLGASLRELVTTVERTLVLMGKVAPESLSTLVASMEEIGLDLEYAVRAWCALERCYMPDEDVRYDPRLVRLSQLVFELYTVVRFGRFSNRIHT
jgi:hypothetical protein